MRYFDLDAGPVVRKISQINNLDYTIDELFCQWLMITGVPATIGFVFGSLASPFMWLLIIPAIIFGLICLIYVTQGKTIGYSETGDGYLTTALHRYEKVRNDPLVSGLAKPLVQTIWNCAEENHPNSERKRDCPVCRPRLAALNQLVPGRGKVSNNDLEEVNNWLEAKKRFELCE